MTHKRAGKSSDNKTIIDGMKHLILCEGRDEWNFLVSYLKSAALAKHPALSKCVQVVDFGGNNELSTQMLLWKNAPGFDNIKSLIVIRDAETNAEGAKKSICKAFKDADLPIPLSPGQLQYGTTAQGTTLSTGFLLFPACDTSLKNGTLEDLCLDILKETDSPVIKEIEGFLNHLESNNLREFPHEFKAKLHTYFSVTDKYVSLKVGEAAKAGAFDWESAKLASLRDFLIKMIAI